jgi:hypothetical protein
MNMAPESLSISYFTGSPPMHAVVSIPDARKGEQLVLVTEKSIDVH